MRLQTTTATEVELNRERASALGRTGRRLEDAIEACHELRRRFEAAPLERRAALAEEYAEARALAKQWLWYLCVQREAIGLRRHDDLERIYVIPPALNR